MLGVGVWDFKGRGRQFTWKWRSKGLVNKCFLGHASRTPSPYSLQPSLVVALFWEQALYLNSFRQLRGGGNKKNFLSFLFLEYNQPRLILMPKRHILREGQALLPRRFMSMFPSTSCIAQPVEGDVGSILQDGPMGTCLPASSSLSVLAHA